MRQGHPRITAVIFDLDNTLLDRDGGFVRFCQELYHASSAIGGARAEDEAIALMKSFDKDGARPRQDFLADLMRAWPGIFESAEQAMDVWLSAFPRMMLLDAPTMFLLEDLQERSFPRAIVTNGGARMQMAKVRESGIEGLIKHIVVSEAVGMSKPDRGIFERALSQMGANPLTTIFVGDNPEADILGAKSLGMVTAWLHRGREWPYGEQPPDYILGHVSEARGLLLG